MLPSRKGKTRGGVGWEEVEGGVELSLEYVELSGGLAGEALRTRGSIFMLGVLDCTQTVHADF